MLYNKEHLKDPSIYKFSFSNKRIYLTGSRETTVVSLRHQELIKKSFIYLSPILFCTFLLLFILYKEFREFIGSFETKR